MNAQPQISPLWKQIKADLQSSISEAGYNTYITNLNLVDITDHTANFTHKYSFLLDQIDTKFSQIIKQTLKKHTGKNLQLKYISPDRPIPTKQVEDLPLFSPETTKDTQLQQAIRNANLLPYFTFDNFAVGSTNQFAYAAAEAVAKQPGKAYNPLFIYGGTGVGKSHLMQAIGHAILKKQPQTKILFCPGEEFTNEIIAAIREKSTLKFKARYRKIDVLLLDDIQFLAGKDTAQEEFFHTFNAINRTGGQIIMTADRPPSDLTLLEDRLRSRFQAGLIVDISEPDFELRTAILLIKSQMNNIDLPMDLAQQVATKLKTARELEGFLLKLKAELMQPGSKMNDPLISQLLQKQITEETQLPANLRPNDVIKATAEYFDLKIFQIKGNRRQARIVRARQIAQYILRIDMNIQYQAIGEYFNGRDHTTIMHSVEKIQKLLGKTPELDEQIMGIKKILRG